MSPSHSSKLAFNKLLPHFDEYFSDFSANFHQRMQVTSLRHGAKGVKIVVLEFLGLPLITWTKQYTFLSIISPSMSSLMDLDSLLDQHVGGQLVLKLLKLCREVGAFADIEAIDRAKTVWIPTSTVDISEDVDKSAPIQYMSAISLRFLRSWIVLSGTSEMVKALIFCRMVWTSSSASWGTFLTTLGPSAFFLSTSIHPLAIALLNPTLAYLDLLLKKSLQLNSTVQSIDKRQNFGVYGTIRSAWAMPVSGMAL